MIDGLKEDVATADAHPVLKEGFVGMTVQGQRFDKRALAGEALGLAAKNVFSQELEPIGEYRGFRIVAQADPWEKKPKVRLAGTLTHYWELGEDGMGNVVRLDNVIKSLPDQLKKAQGQLEELQRQVEQARQKMNEPFLQEEEYQLKSSRLQELSAELNIDGKAAIQEEDPAKSTSKEVYDLGFGHLGNGITVWNRAQEECGDYKTIAHISPDREVKFYEQNLPEEVQRNIREVAVTSTMTISAAQIDPYEMGHQGNSHNAPDLMGDLETSELEDDELEL